MKNTKKVLLVLLCALLLLPALAACGGGGTGESGLGNVTYGRYVEEDISPEGMRGYPQSFVQFPDGTLDVTVVDYGSEETGFVASYKRWRSTDNGENWTPIDMSWTQAYAQDYSEYYDRGETPPETVGLGTILPLANGDMVYTVYHSFYDAATDYYSEQNEIYRRSADGAETVFSIPVLEQAKAEGRSVSLYDMRSLPGGRMYLHLYRQPTPEEQNDPNYDYSSAEQRGVYSEETGEKLYDITSQGWQMFHNNETLFLFDYDGNLNAYNLADGTPATLDLPKTELLQRLSQGYMGTSFVDDEYNFYSVGARGLERMNAESDDFTRVMDGLNYTYGSPLYSISSVVYNPTDVSMIMAVSDAYDSDNTVPQGRLLRYVWDDEAIASSDKKIRVYSLYENYTVRLALSEFKRQNPEVTVEYETAFSQDPNSGMMVRMSGDTSGGESSAQTEEDALRALNTELLNGTGPDILILDGLPVESLVEKGVLADLSEQLAGNIDLMEELLEPMYTDGKLYAVPTNIFVPVLLGDKGYVEQYTDFETLVAAIEAGPGPAPYEEYNPEWTEEEANAYYERMYGRKPAEEQPVLYLETLDDTFETFYASCAPAIFSEKGGINEENLSVFLQAVKRVSDKFELTASGAGYGGGYASMSTGYAYYEYSQSLSRYTSYQSRLGYSRLGSLTMLRSASSSLFYSANPDVGKGVAVEDDAAAQPEETPQEETLPVSEPNVVLMPGLTGGVYFPVQIVGVTTTTKQMDLARAFVDTMLSEGVQKYDLGNGFPVTHAAFDYQYENYMARDQYMVEQGMTMMPFPYESLAGSLSTPFYTNGYLRTAIFAPVMEYCQDLIGLDMAISRVVKETELYFAERQ